ncbi:aspartate carbamoyltransferase catalytic subunit [Anaplasma phagocytophilum str. Norway variant1]|uniref:Aspartate carbamoyltransferase n=1 Tax=Anaplasma phagocytophilum str. Norway variant1 TaxID=1392506 RepID=A0A7H9DYL3_ANAPH|nr:aspartate carbamoyltransferase catalytic subunit [Anaplasma phagocytophilum]QLL66672.1 aspartate carbamoyltransferase catalytic subunit [Anaplasma phagocytophilum str. Norway variant1]
MKKLNKLLRIQSLSDIDIENIVTLAHRYLQDSSANNVLQGRVIANLFFENSTRTLLAFEIAEKSLGAVSVTLNVETSSMKKGESVSDTLSTLSAMGVDLVVVRSGFSGFIDEVVERVGDCCVINAGDGNHEHPTQALTDYATISYLKGKDIEGLNVTICGDIFHSRVARSNMRLLSRYGANINVVTPPCWSASVPSSNVTKITHSLEEGIKDADVIMLLRIQKERMSGASFISANEYSRHYMLDKAKLSIAKDDVIIMHPGPMNRGIEISDEVADASSSILLQVKMGVAVRKAILHYMLG